MMKLSNIYLAQRGLNTLNAFTYKRPSLVSLLLISLSCLSLLSLLGGCDESTTEEEMLGGASGEQSGGANGAELCDHPVGECLSIGWTKSGNLFTMTVKDATPIPAIKGLNQWTLTLSDGESAIDGCEMEVVPFMPDHNHGSTNVEGTSIGDGDYQVDQLDLIMPGLWEIRFNVSCEVDGEQREDQVVFPLWLEG